jgi:alpha-ribazole phosphatase
MKWIWIRHGETDLNRRRCYLGHVDVPLNDKGYEQIDRLLDTCWGVTRVFSSDLLRCKQSAEILIETVEVQYTRALRELHFGDWEGKRYEEIMQTAEADLLTSWYQDPFFMSPPGGETLQQLGRRVDTWLLDALSRLSDEDVILVVTHGGPLRWLLSRWMLGDARQFWDVQAVTHGGGFMVEWDGVRWGEPQFFGGEL